MNYRALPLQCYCGQVPDQILEVGFTSEKHLVIHYWCAACNRVIFMTRTLDECRDLCPEPQVDLSTAEAEDLRFLQSMGIRSGE